MNKISFLPDKSLRQIFGFAAFFTLIVTLLSGCSPSTLSNMWHDTSYTSTMKNVLVIAVRKDPVRRRLWEDGFVTELTNHGVTATPSYRLFPDAIPDTARVLAAISANGYDGVLVTTRLGVDTVSTYVPGYRREVPITRYNQIRNQYYTYYRTVTDSGYTEMERIVRHQVNVWTTLEGGRLVWSGTGIVEEQGVTQSVNHEITESIIPELANIGIIPGKK